LTHFVVGRCLTSFAPPPREGKLLRLPVGSCVRIGETVARVTDRATADRGGRHGCGVIYTCQSATDEFQILVSLGSETPPVPSVRIGHDARTRDVAVHEIETFG
jgi:hypothetical protein